MALNYTIVVDDNGELKMVTASEVIDELAASGYLDLMRDLDGALNSILDRRAADAHNAAIRAARKTS